MNQIIIKKHNHLVNYLRPFRKILLIVGKKSFINNELYKYLINKFENLYIYRVLDPKPTFKTSYDISKLINKFEIIVAIGGGTIMDTAKLSKYIYITEQSNLNKLLQINGKITLNNNKKINLCVAPTTAGSGAETTKFCVTYFRNIKFSLEDEKILPNCIYFNYNFLLTNKRIDFISSGLDALSQTIESIWSINANSVSLKYSFEALELILKSFRDALDNKNFRCFKNMQVAAYLAGKAINISKTTAPHAFSYYLTAFHDIPHGLAVGHLLPKFYKECKINVSKFLDKKSYIAFNKLDRILNKYSCGQDFFTLFYKQIKFTNHQKRLSITQINIDRYLRHINLQRLSNHPIKINKSIAKKYLNEIFINS